MTSSDNNKARSRLFLIWSKSRGCYRSLRKLLANDGWQVLIVEDLASLQRLRGPESSEVDSKLNCLAILDPSREPTDDELKHIREFVARDPQHSALLVASSACENEDASRDSANLNELVRPFGVIFQEDCIIRPNPYKLYHPQEAVVEDFVANRGLGEVLKRHIASNPSEDSLAKPQDGPVKFGPRLVYPRGCSMIVSGKLSTIVMTSSRFALPSEQPIGVLYRPSSIEEQSIKSWPLGRAIILGSASLMSDRYLGREDNQALVCSFVEFLTNKNFPINISDARTIEIAANNLTADLDRLCQNPIGCLRRLDPLPRRRTDLIDRRLFSIDNSKLPQVAQAYAELQVDHEPLTLVKPSFEWALNGEHEQLDRKKPRFLLKQLQGVAENKMQS